MYLNTSGLTGRFKIDLKKYINVKKKDKWKGSKIKVGVFFPKGNFFQSVSILYVL